MHTGTRGEGEPSTPRGEERENQAHRDERRGTTKHAERSGERELDLHRNQRPPRATVLNAYDRHCCHVVVRRTPRAHALHGAVFVIVRRCEAWLSLGPHHERVPHDRSARWHGRHHSRRRVRHALFVALFCRGEAARDEKSEAGGPQ